MVLDPRISLAATAPNLQSSMELFQNTLTQQQNREAQRQQMQQQAALAPFQQQIAQQQAQAGQLEVNQARQNQRLLNIHQTGQQLKPFLDSGDIQGAQNFLLNNMSGIQSRIEQGSGENIDDSMEVLQRLQQGDVQGVQRDISALSNIVGQQQKQFALQSNAPITDPVTGQVSTPVFNPATGQTKLVPIEGAIKETPTKIAEREQRSAKKLAQLDIETTAKKEAVKKTAARTSSLKAEFSERRRQAARSKRKISEAKKLAERATQGLLGAGKVQLGRVFPGIDAKDEAGLAGALKSLALDELSKFKGPTTDFEFRVTEDIAGSLGDGASANKARLASLERASWFADRESKQFNDHIKAGHDPDEFFFNFNELITPKKGGKSYSLQDLQDTAVANHISVDEVIKRLSR